MADERHGRSARQTGTVGAWRRRLRDGLLRRWRRWRIGVLSRLGRYERWREVDWARVERLVFVCTGNICRSPFAEVVTRQRGRTAISCGTRARTGAPVNPVASHVAGRSGVDLAGHASLALETAVIGARDLLVAMDVDHLAEAHIRAEDGGAQVTLLGLWDRAQPVVIHDPYGRPEAEFTACFKRIERCLDKLLAAWDGARAK